MNKYIIIALVLIVTVVMTMGVIRHQDSPSGQVPNLDAAAIETGKNLRPPKLNP